MDGFSIWVGPGKGLRKGSCGILFVYLDVFARSVAGPVTVFLSPGAHLRAKRDITYY